jgi:hypothetical protein
MVFTLLNTLLFAAAPHLTPPQLPRPMLWLGTNTYHTDRPGDGSSASARPVDLMRPISFVTYSASMCGFSAGVIPMDPNAELGWRVTVLTKSITTESNVILNVTWTRERHGKVEAHGASEVLMRPGDSVPLDVAETPEHRKLNGCGMTSAALELQLEPVSWSKARTGAANAVSTDMWLVRRLPDGQEQTEQINVRSVINEEVPFYFSDLKSGELLMSVNGSIRARARDNGSIALEFSAHRYLEFSPGVVERGFTSLPPGSKPLVFDSAQDVISVEFPLSSNPKWKDFGSQPMSIRIKTRRLR